MTLDLTILWGLGLPLWPSLGAPQVTEVSPRHGHLLLPVSDPSLARRPRGAEGGPVRTTSGGWDLRQDAEGPRSGFGCTFRGVMGQADTAGQPGLDWGGAVVSPPQVLGGLHPNATWTPPPPAPWRG